MAELTNFKSVSISKLMANLDRYKYNPDMRQVVMLDYLQEVTNGEVDIVDPTNPFVFLMESSAVNTASALVENIINLRKQYPSLAQTEEDLYLHMSDKDFIDRFAVPSETDFTFVVQANSLYQQMVYDAVEQCGKVTIPRDTEFMIDDIIFTLQYPIHIRKFDNGILQISYDAAVISPLQTLTSNIIEPIIRRDGNSIDWIFFKIPVYQIQIQTTYVPIQHSALFSHNVNYKNQFYFCRVLYKNSGTLNQWKDLIVTHTDQVFDPFKPTAVLKVFNGIVNVSIPKIYFTSGLLSGDIRIDVYTTRGELTINLANYKFNSFSTRLKAIDEQRDLNDYTNALALATYYTYSDQLVSGGTNGIDFATLRERVIHNSVGDRQLPITNNQLEAYVSKKGFDLVKNVDTVTNRIFLATQKLPKPLNSKLLTAANIGIGTLITNLTYLSQIDRVRINNLRQTILSNNLYKNENGVVRLLSAAERQALDALPRSEFLSVVNSSYYLYNPFYYVLDNSTQEFEVRAYNLDYPLASQLSFISQNQSLQLPVNTGQYTIEKVSQGYKLTIVTKSGNFYKQLETNLVHLQLGYLPAGETHLAYINGTYVQTTADEERVYEFLLETNYDLNKDHHLAITNGRMFSNEAMTTWMDLNLKVYLFHTTTSLTEGYVPDVSTALLGDFLLPVGSACVTHETLELELGSSLGNLWSRSRSFASGLDYQRYTDDIPLLYERVIYATDPTTNSIFSVDGLGNLVYTVLHQIGDPVLDDFGTPVYKHRKNDVVLDAGGQPIVVSSLSADKEIDMLFVDGKYYFTTDTNFVNYRAEIAAILDTWIVRDLVSIQQLLLEQTKIYFYPKTTIGLVKVFTENNQEDMISSEQSLVVDLYVTKAVYDDNEIRSALKDLTVRTIDSYINKSTINITEITAALTGVYTDSVKAVSLSGLGGAKDYQVVNLAAEHNRLSLSKQLIQQQDGSLIIQEAVTVNFYNVEKSL